MSIKDTICPSPVKPRVFSRQRYIIRPGFFFPNTMRLLSRIWMWLRALVRHDASWPYTRSIATTDMSAVTKRAKNRPQHKASIASTETWVKLPDLFQSFLKDPPPVNPHYETVRIESEQWLSKSVQSLFAFRVLYRSLTSLLSFCDFPADLIKRVHKCDFSYFCAIVAPYAPADRFRILCDWGNWVCAKQTIHARNNLKLPKADERFMSRCFLTMIVGEMLLIVLHT